jgi:SAM-dependent methyltransferase
MKYIGKELDIFSKAINWKKYWYSFIEPYLKGNIAEIGSGCGNNSFLIVNNEKINTIYCVEPDAELIQFSKAKINNTKITYINGFLSDIPLEKTFDAILYIDVLEHIEKDVEELEKASFRLKKNGVLIVLSPAFPFLFTEFDKAVGHYRRYKKSDFLRLTNKTLNPLKCQYLDSFGVILSFSNKFLASPQPSFSQIQFWDKCVVPISKVMDFLFNYRFGKSILMIWQKI